MHLAQDLSRVTSEQLLLPEVSGRRHLYPTPSPDGQQVAFLSLQGDVAGIYVVPMTGGEPVLVTDVSGLITPAESIVLLEWR